MDNHNHYFDVGGFDYQGGAFRQASAVAALANKINVEDRYNNNGDNDAISHHGRNDTSQFTDGNHHNGGGNNNKKQKTVQNNQTMTDNSTIEQRLSTAEANLSNAETMKKQYEAELLALQGKLEAVKLDVIRYSEEIETLQLEVPNQWNTMYKRLLAYKEEHGDCLVPLSYKADKSLGRFVGNQRVFYKYYQNGDTKHIKASRIAALNKIGFVWNVKEKQFQDMLIQLEDFVRQNGHANVPKVYKENPNLATWVLAQRYQRNKQERGEPSTLTPQRIQKLNALGFKWSDGKHPLDESTTEDGPRRSNNIPSAYRDKTPEEVWNLQYGYLQKFHKEHGHTQISKRSLSKEWKKWVVSHGMLKWVGYQRRQQVIFLQRQQEEQHQQQLDDGDKKQQRQQQTTTTTKQPACWITQEQIDKLDALGFTWTRPQNQPRKNTGGGNGSGALKRKRTKTSQDDPEEEEEEEDDHDKEEDEELAPRLDAPDISVV